VPGAKVTITNAADPMPRAVRGRGTGAYLFDLITPGGLPALRSKRRDSARRSWDNVRAMVGKPTETNVAIDRRSDEPSG